MSQKSVLLIGATGLIGNLTLQLLLADSAIGEVRIIARRSTGLTHQKLKELVIDFETLSVHHDFMHCDVYINCMGSTMKKAGSKLAFEKFDLIYPLQIAKICKENGTQKMVLLSALGANEKSSIFYSSIKGRLENECIKIGFKSLLILQPSLLIGNRTEKRLLEVVSERLMNLLSFLIPKKYEPIEATKLAEIIVALTIKEDVDKVQKLNNENF